MKQAIKRLTATVLIALALLYLAGCVSPGTGKAVGTAHLAIRCDRALTREDLPDGLRDVLPEDGVIGDGQVTVYEGDTVFTLLERFCREHDVAMSSTGATRYGVYVDGIGGLFERDAGSGSGWMYAVNGEFLNKSAGDAAVKDGDDVLWVYTLDLGKDVEGHAS